jgi:hypothetical protein
MSHSNDNNILDSILDTEYVVYTYLTPEYKPGAVIVDPKFRPIFDEKHLFEMESLQSTTLKLRDILVKGFISVGSTDLMDSIDITHPHKYIVEQSGAKSTIKGRYFHGSRRDLIAKPTGIDFTYDPVSDEEKSEDEEKENNINDDYHNEMNTYRNDHNQLSESDETVVPRISMIDSHQNDLKWLCEEEVV